MKTSLPKKSKSHQNKLNQITNIITKIGGVKIAFVILFGSFARGSGVYDRYIEDGITYEYASDYDILIITKTKKQAGLRSAITLKNKIEKEIEKQGLDKKPYCAGHSTTLIVEAIDKVNSELEKNRYFFRDIKKEGIVLYDSKEFELSKPKKLSDKERKEIAQEDYEYWFDSGSGFLRDSKNTLEINDYKKSAFYLHQATESLYHCMLLTFTGYKHKTHDIGKLNKFCAAWSNKFLNIFPRATEEQQKCFDLLKAAYIEARYNKNYLITKTQLECLMKRVVALKEITREICEEKIRSFDNNKVKIINSKN